MARWIVEKISPETVGKVFEKARKVWKRSTYRTKRDRLV
jgi:RPA family protein